MRAGCIGVVIVEACLDCSAKRRCGVALERTYMQEASRPAGLFVPVLLLDRLGPSLPCTVDYLPRRRPTPSFQPYALIRFPRPNVSDGLFSAWFDLVAHVILSRELQVMLTSPLQELWSAVPVGLEPTPICRVRAILFDMPHNTDHAALASGYSPSQVSLQLVKLKVEHGKISTSVHCRTELSIET